MGSSESETEMTNNNNSPQAPAVTLTTTTATTATTTTAATATPTGVGFDGINDTDRTYTMNKNNILEPPPANMVRSLSANQPSPILVSSSNSHPSPPQHSFYPSRRSVSTSAGDLLTGLKIMTTVHNDNSNPTSPIPSSAATTADPHVISSIDDFHIKAPIGMHLPRFHFTRGASPVFVHPLTRPSRRCRLWLLGYRI